ncbi:hypothetical protein [Paenibacillus polymyxa]|uniref:hypothetical protein n=1 Tax=Paenibacillus polymyxa TaxID=1406 RepID=UPI0025B72CA8|nr:hypothetical protein [Paenibacillus polymyxa]MDN4090897.1 hypothetical protein [Paenibacillus polymyxa]
MSSEQLDFNSYQNEEHELLSASMMGDIREDVEFLGLTLTDMMWICVHVFTWGIVPIIIQLSWWICILWFLFVLGFSFVGRCLKWPYRRKRWFHERRQKKMGTGEEIASLLGVEEESWYYRSPRVIHIVLNITAPPWEGALVQHKRSRINNFEYFIRNCVMEGFTAQISSEQVPDYQHSIWDEKKDQPSATEGIQQLKLNRIRMWEEKAASGLAKRSEYTMSLWINEISIKVREREDEPTDLDKKELYQFRMITELHDKLQRAMSPMLASGHTFEITGGSLVAERLSRWWDRNTWEVWKRDRGTWEEDEPEPTMVNLKKSSYQPKLAQLLEAGVISSEEKTTEDSMNMSVQEQEILTESRADQGAEEERTVKPKRQKSRIVAILAAVLSFFTSQWSKLKLRFRPAPPQRVDVSNWIDALTEEDNPQNAKTALSGAESEEAPNTSEISEHAVQAEQSAQNSNFKRTLQSTVQWMKQEAVRLHELKPGRKKKESAAAIESMDNTEESNSEVPDVSSVPHHLTGIYVLTAPSPTGVTFLASNVAAAMSTEDRPMTLIDLSRDQGTKTILNPLKAPEELSFEGWEAWTSVHAPGLTLYTPLAFPMQESVSQLIEKRCQVGPVLVDMPWHFPDRQWMLENYQSVAVVDSDYHHWLQWEQAAAQWPGHIWLNQMDAEMTNRMSSLIRHHFGKQAWATFPAFHEAKHWIYQGRPLATHEPSRRHFVIHETEVG